MKIFLPVLLSLGLCSCSIVSQSKLDGFAKLKQWKEDADEVHLRHSSQREVSYEIARKAVDEVIDVKKAEVTTKSENWLPLGVVNGSVQDVEAASPGVSGKVSTALERGQPASPTPAAVDPATVAAILEFIRKELRAGRIAEANELKQLLEKWRWKKWN